MKNIAIFASGNGSNARRIIEYFQAHPAITVALVLSNRPDAPVLAMAASHGVDTLVFDRQQFYQTEDVRSVLEKYDITLVVLAGFLWLVPPYLTEAYQGRIINIHPALLPRYGGAGMYGLRVHEAVKAAQEGTTGITIHYVNEHYDEGQIIFQAQCAIDPMDTPQDIAQKVQTLEHAHFPRVIEQLLLGNA